MNQSELPEFLEHYDSEHFTRCYCSQDAKANMNVFEEGLRELLKTCSGHVAPTKDMKVKREVVQATYRKFLALKKGSGCNAGLTQ